MGRILILGLMLCGGSASAQETRTIFHLSLRLMELRFAADTVSGVHVLMQPSARSKQANEPNSLVWLRFHPDTVLEWINSAAAALRVPVPSAQADGIQWSRTLLPRDGKGAIAVGRVRKKGKLQNGRWLAIADSTTGWRAEMDGTEADSLLKLLLLVGSQSRLDTTDAAALEADRVDVPVSLVHQPAPTWSPYGRGRRVADGRPRFPAWFGVRRGRCASAPVLQPAFGSPLGLEGTAVRRIGKQATAVPATLGVWVYRPVGDPGLPTLCFGLLRAYADDPAQHDLQADGVPKDNSAVQCSGLARHREVLR